MNNIEHTIVFTFSTVKGALIEAKWIITIKNSNSKNGHIQKNLKIKNTPCSIEQHNGEWALYMHSDGQDNTRDYLEMVTEITARESSIYIKIAESEKDYIESIANDFIQPFENRIASLKEAYRN